MQLTLNAFISAFCDQHRLPGSFESVATDYYGPLAEKVYQQLSAETFVLGVNGAQGTGKSTLADFIAQYLQSQYDLNVASLSIDDIYLTRAEREQLSKEIHPLFVTRGVPGTHDVQLGLSLLEGLKSLHEGEALRLPRFDKSIDDRFPESEWTEVVGPIDLVIFEGWCVGSESESDDTLLSEVNQFEAEEDADRNWRCHANDCLSGNYRELFGYLDALVMLQAPDFECVYRWRLEQEQKLASTVKDGAVGVMNAEQIRRFIQHYERITRRNLSDLSQKADVLIKLGQDHQVVSMTGPLG